MVDKVIEEIKETAKEKTARVVKEQAGVRKQQLKNMISNQQGWVNKLQSELNARIVKLNAAQEALSELEKVYPDEVEEVVE